MANFSKKIASITGIDYEYKAPRRRAKNPDLSNNYSNDASYLSPAESPRGGSSRRRRKNRSNSNSSVGSNNSVGKKKKGQPAKTGKELRVETNAQNATLMKQWLQTRSIFHKGIFFFVCFFLFFFILCFFGFYFYFFIFLFCWPCTRGEVSVAFFVFVGQVV